MSRVSRNNTPRRGLLRAGNSGLLPLVLNAPSERSPTRNGHGYGATGDRFAGAEESEDESLNTRAMKRVESYFHVMKLVDDRGGDYEKYRIDTESDEYKSRKKKIRKFYDHQNGLLDGFAEVDTIIDDCFVDEERDIESAPLLPKNLMAGPSGQTRETKIMVAVNFIVNVILLVAKVIVALLSGSISVIASTVDSAMDFLSTLIIFVSNWFSDSRGDDWKGNWQWPAGRRRMEPMGVVIFSVAMIASFVQVFIESIQRLRQKDLQTVELGGDAVAIMLATIAIKLVMWIWCRRAKSSSVQALAQDAENDVFFNIGSLVFPALGQLFKLKWLDALGGALLSIYIIKEWTETLLNNTRNLLGARASPAEHQRVCYLITRFSPLVKGVQHLEVYTAGEELIVESDIILPATTSLPLSHNVGESIQLALESLSGVSRAYVHLDFSSANPSSHQKK